MEDVTTRVNELRGKIERTVIHNSDAENTPLAGCVTDCVNHVVETTDPETLMHADIITSQIVTAGNARIYWQMLRPETLDRIKHFYARVGIAAAPPAESNQYFTNQGARLVNKV